MAYSRASIAVLLGLALLAADVGCYKLPRWSGEVDVSPLRRDAVDRCGDGAITREGATVFQRHPYLQDVTSDSAVVAWASWPDDISVIVSKPDQEAATFSARYAGDRRRRASRERLLKERERSRHGDVRPADFYPLRADIDGLDAATLYCYQLVREGTTLTEPAPLMTAPAPGSSKKVKFVALGDTGTGGAAQAAIAQRLSEHPFELLLFLGDLAYSSGTPQQIQDKFFEVYTDYLRFVPAYPAIGNHERRTRGGRPFFEAFMLPEPESYYSFDWGSIHFVAFDSTRPSARQREWLAADLAQNDLPWIIAFGHHPLYSNSFRGPTTRIRGGLERIFRDAGVDLVLTGHEHHYERFRPIGGVVYVVSGGGGGRLTKIFNNTLTVKQAAVHHFLTFEVTPERLEMKAFDIEGNEIDQLVLASRRHR